MMDVLGFCVPLLTVEWEKPLKNCIAMVSSFFALLMSSIPAFQIERQAQAYKSIIFLWYINCSVNIPRGRVVFADFMITATGLVSGP